MKGWATSLLIPLTTEGLSWLPDSGVHMRVFWEDKQSRSNENTTSTLNLTLHPLSGLRLWPKHCENYEEPSSYSVSHKYLYQASTIMYLDCLANLFFSNWKNTAESQVQRFNSFAISSPRDHSSDSSGKQERVSLVACLAWLTLFATISHYNAVALWPSQRPRCLKQLQAVCFNLHGKTH